MTDWSSLVAVPAPDFDPFDIGGVSEIKLRFGLAEAAKLHWNENLFGALPGVLEAAQEELENAWMYPEDAYQGFREDVAELLGITPACVFPGHGAQSLIGTIATVLLRPGDSVVVPELTYYLYGRACLARGATVHAVPLRDLRVDVDALVETAHRTSARALWLCDPNNPTGDLLPQEAWDTLLDRLPETCVAVVDEAYVDYVPEEARVPRVASVAERRVVVLRTFSKLFGLAGLRLGYAVAAEELVPSFALVEEPYNVNCVALAAGRACVRAREDVARRRAEVSVARDLLVEGLRRAGAEPFPSVANFVLARVDVDDALLADGLARRGLLIRPGSQLGLPRHVRVTVGPAALMERLVDAFGEVASELRS